MKTYTVIGMMSGTSLDGIDGVLFKVRPSANIYSIETLASVHQPYPTKWGTLLRTISKDNLLREGALFGAAWAELSAVLVRRILARGRKRANQVDVLGVHGQTVAHLPERRRFLDRSVATTIQLGDLSRLAIRTGIAVVGNFRLADMAMGGQGAPLVPHAHRLIFGRRGVTVAVQNLGGIGNVTLIRNGEVKLAFDTGPANLWIDTLVRTRTRGKYSFDRNGHLAKKGRVDEKIKTALLSHPYFRKKPPKSAGWEEFGDSYLNAFEARLSRMTLQDAVATVTQATVEATVYAYEKFVYPVHRPEQIILAGGGARNDFVVRALSEHFDIPVTTSQALGIHVSDVEAISFGLLALQTLRGKPNNEPKATGAKRHVIGGQMAFPLVKGGKR